MKVPFIFRTIVDSISDDLPDIPKNGIEGYRRHNEPRPCIDLMRASTGVRPGSRNQIIFSIANELNRRGWALEETEQECQRVNQKGFTSSLSSREVTVTVRSAFKRNYAQGCSDVTLRKYCADFDGCKWRKQALRYSVSALKDEDIFRKNWFSRLRPPVREVYLHLLKLEHKRSSRKDAPISRSFRQIAQDLQYPDKGVARRAVKKLQTLGLIEVLSPPTADKTDIASGLATRFRRITPVPMPGQIKKEKTK